MNGDEFGAPAAKPGPGDQPTGRDVDEGTVPGLTSLLNEHREAGGKRHRLLGDQGASPAQVN